MFLSNNHPLLKPVSNEVTTCVCEEINCFQKDDVTGLTPQAPIVGSLRTREVLHHNFRAAELKAPCAKFMVLVVVGQYGAGCLYLGVPPSS